MHRWSKQDHDKRCKYEGVNIFITGTRKSSERTQATSDNETNGIHLAGEAIITSAYTK